MHFNGGFGDSDISGNLLVQPSSRDFNHDLAFSWAQQLEALSNCLDRLLVLDPGAITFEPDVNRVYQVLVTKWLGQKFDGATFHRSHRHGYVAVPRDEDDRDVDVRSIQFALEIETTSPRQPNVEHKASRALRAIGLKEIGDGGK